MTMAGSATADSSSSDLPPTWHVHDCGLAESTSACGGQHKVAGFFPAVLEQSNAEYVADPARCPDATVTAFLPSAVTSEGAVLRAGICQTSAYVIHLRTVLFGVDGPSGWSSRPGPESGYVTYYFVTQR
jgi:hypothetical protein